jgi:C4-dicarboxylate-specific signal transduction histidine kinase
VPWSEIVLILLNDWPSHLGDAVEFQVFATNAGIPEEIMDKLVQPFFTTKPTGEGAGLGLSITSAAPAIAAETDVES